MTTASAISSECSRLRNARSAKRIGLEISSSEKEPSSLRIGDSPATLRGGVRLIPLCLMAIRRDLNKAVKRMRDEVQDHEGWIPSNW